MVISVGFRRPLSRPLRYCWLRPDRAATSSCVRYFSRRMRAKFLPTKVRISICNKSQFTYYRFIIYNMYFQLFGRWSERSYLDGCPKKEFSKFNKKTSSRTISQKFRHFKSGSNAIIGLEEGSNGLSPSPLHNSDLPLISTTHATARVALPALSPRQCEVLYWAAHGKSAWETAQVLGLKEATVKSYIANACAKLCADNKTHAVAIVISRGLFSVRWQLGKP